MPNHYNITIQGKVQGVSYRVHALQMAELLGLKGRVRNLPNGDVLAEAEGDEEMLVRFIQWCHQGSPQAVVTYVSVEAGPLQHYTEFRIDR